MFKFIRSFFSRNKEDDEIPLSSTDNILDFIGGIKTHQQKTFKPSKTKTITLSVHTQNLEELRPLLAQAAIFISKGEYVPEAWKYKVRVKKPITLEDYLSDTQNTLVHPVDWLIENDYYIKKILTALSKLDEADSDYYNRQCQFIIDDLSSLVTSLKNILV